MDSSMYVGLSQEDLCMQLVPSLTKEHIDDLSAREKQTQRCYLLGENQHPLSDQYHSFSYR
jgi:hypothetical protein